MPDVDSHLLDHPTERLVGKAAALVALRAQIRRLAAFDNLGSPLVPTVLLQGETGTGKGLVARVMHDSGPRASGPFVEVNCAAIPDAMLEAELFGFEAGTFTDAKRAKPGLFEAASAGALFLDEIDALPLRLQGKLLTAIETKRVRRLGAVVERTVDVKLIAASNTVLAKLLAAGRFRADLYHRLAVVVLALPALRERGDDVLLLAEAYLQRYTVAHGVPPKHLSTEAAAWLRSYAWPGNVRELSHVMERVTLLHVGQEVDAKTLMQLCLPLTAPEVSTEAAPVPTEVAGELAQPVEAEQVRQALAQTGGNVTQAARILGVSRDAVRYRMQRYGITRPHLGISSPQASHRSSGATAQGVPLQEGGLPRELTSSFPPFPSRQQAKSPPQSDAQHDAGHDTAMAGNEQPPELAWEQQPVAVLALEMTWPAASDVESIRYDPWTERARWEEAIVDKVRGFGGAILQRAGSQLVWVFGMPQMLEQLPQRAVHSAMAIRQMVRASAPDLPLCPIVRMAVHLGTVRVDRQATDLAAHVRAMAVTLTLAVQLLGQAEAGAVVISPEVARLVDSWVAMEARPLQLRGGDAERAGGYAVVGVSPGRKEAGPRAALARTPFVGRARELEILYALLDHVKAGRGQVVSVVGAPGMGKSRLLETFCQGLTDRGVRYVAGQCLAYGSGVPYLPVLELLRDLCGIIVNERPETIRTKVRDSLQQLDLDPDANLPDVLDLLDRPDDADTLPSLSAETRKARTFETVRQVFLTSSQRHPLVLAVEDLHWIDPTSEALLASLVDALAGAPLLLLATCRPGYRPPWLDKSYASQIALQPLRPDDSRQVLRHVVRGPALTPTLEQQLLAKGEGNPFFLEELAYTALEHGEGHPNLVVPDSIQAVLASRMDRLPTAERQLLQTAAVFGKDFPVPVLQAVTELPEVALQPRLANLQAAEFLYESRLFPERTYTFKHALTQDVAYGSLLQVQRRALHARFVEVLETLYRNRLIQQVERLAYHALQGEVWDKALAFCRQAGAKALTHSAYHEAAEFFEQALNALRHLPACPETQAQAIDLRLNLRAALWPLGDLGRISVTLQEAESLAEALGDQQRLGWVSAALLAHFMQGCELDRAMAAGRRALARATALSDVGLRIVTQHNLGHVYHSAGNYRRAVESFQNVVVTLHNDLHQEHFGLAGPVSVLSRAHLSHCLAELGVFSEGMAHACDAVRMAEATDHPYSRVLANWAVGVQYLYKGDQDQAIPMLERSLDLARGAHIHLAVPWVSAFLGTAYAQAGRTTDALPLLEQSVERAIAMRLMVEHACRVVWLGEAYLQADRLEEAGIQARWALEFSRAHQERAHEAYALRLLGDIAARCKSLEDEQAEDHYRQALSLADELGMRPLVAHCHLGLGTLYRQMGRGEEARAALSSALALYRAMDMTFWLAQVDAALAQAG
jgi:DNA-binding NtrC family response regulator/tetratricopeptide (TPR) repeat protein